MKLTPVKSLKKKADVLMSLYIRKRDKRCVLCGTTLKLQCGHLISRRKNSVRWDDVNCNCQCWGCNLRHNQWPEYYTNWFIKEYGQSMYEDLVDRSQKIIKVNRVFLEGIIEKIEDKMSKL